MKNLIPPGTEITGSAIAHESDSPFRHWVVDDLHDLDLVKRAGDSFPSSIWHHWVKYDGGLMCSTLPVMPDPIRELIYPLNTGKSAAELSVMTEVPNLVPDPAGAGMYAMQRDDRICVQNPIKHRLTMIVYLNQDWNSQWGGAFELFDPHLSPTKAILPKMGRTVIFENNQGSFHGITHRLVCPPGAMLKMLMLYFSSSNPPQIV